MHEMSGFSVPSVIPKLHIACLLLPVMTDPLYLNLIVISSRDKQWLLLMEVNASHWTWGRRQAIHVKESYAS